MTPLVFDLSLKIADDSLAADGGEGWKILAVYGSANPNDTALNSLGTIMKARRFARCARCACWPCCTGCACRADTQAAPTFFCHAAAAAHATPLLQPDKATMADALLAPPACI